MNTSKNKDLAYAMKPLKILSWCMGVWPFELNSIFSLVRFNFVIGILLLMILMLYVEVYLDSSDAEANLDVLLLSSCGFLAISKITCFRVYSANLMFNFVSATKDYDDVNDERKRKIMRRHAYMARVAFAGLMFTSNFGSMVITVVPILLKIDEETNVTVEDTVKYPIPSAHIIQELNFPDNLRPIIFFMEFLMMVVTSAGCLGSDGFFFGIVFHLCGQVEVLKMEFSRLVDENGRITKDFQLLIKRHDYLLKLGEMLNNMISVVLAIQLLISCLLICTCGFQFLLALQDGNVMMVMKTIAVLNALVVQLFAYSYVGDYLKCQMDEVGSSLYSCGWYTLPANVAKDIVLVILKSRKPVQMMAGKFFVVNLEGFMSIVKTSMSYLSVLRVMITA